MDQAANIPNEEEILAIVRAHGSVLQFKNSIKFVQGSTSMSLERMNKALDLMCAMLYADGMSKGMAIAREITTKAINEKGAPTSDSKRVDR